MANNHSIFRDGGIGSGGTPIQKPGPVIGRNKYSTAEAPASSTVVKRCSYVMINQTGSYAFAYDSGSALIANVTHQYVTASVVLGDIAGTSGSSGVITPYKLDINPVSWRRIEEGISGDVGQVTFVYVRVM
tara:strand:+ start:18 stop:410 length:393 start_codon:yes stop_codon:yes gene_type:complete